MADYTTDGRPSVSGIWSMPGEQSCPICRLCTGATVDTRRERVDKTSACAAHGPLLSWVRQSFRNEINHLDSQGIYRPKRSWAPYTLGFYRESGHLPKINYVDYKRRPRFSRELLLSLPEDKKQSGIRKHNLDPKWVNLQIARRWMDSCIKEHGSRCTNTFKAPPCSPAYLIDTKRDCILQPGDEELEYVALSYRWGDQEGFRTDSTSVVCMTDEGSLRRTEGIPPMIHHAMHIVRSIGARYLWVDSICLISDDKEHLTEQLQLMGSIYARANLTIVATDGDAWDGLDGIQEAPGAPGKSRDLPNTFCYPNGVQITVRDQPSLSQILGSAFEYFQRGWTYQEYYLSQRRLIFGKKQMHWSCSCATWHEDDPDSREDSKEDSNQMIDDQHFQISNILSGKTDLGELAKLAFEYHPRDFTRPDDALPGLAGLLTLLTRTFEGGFLCGHPETWFDAALMWHCNFHGNVPGGYARKPTLERRRIATQPSTLPGAVLPSWSWIGWKGNQLRFLDDEEDFELPQGLTEGKTYGRWRYITTPVTEWYSHETPTSTKRRIQSFPQLPNGDGNMGDSYQGWRMETYDPIRHPFVEDEKSKFIGKSVYQHPTIPHAYFWAPFPKFGVGQGTSICALKQYQYISCRTKRGWFGVKSTGSDRRPKSGLSFDAQASLTDDQGRECGWLQLAPSDEIASMLRRSHHGSDTDEALAKSIAELTIELVAVCQRRRSCPCWPWTGGGCNCNEDLCGVLWVKWVDGVAYRRGCGYVMKEMWDSHKLEDVDLVLG